VSPRKWISGSISSYSLLHHQGGYFEEGLELFDHLYPYLFDLFGGLEGVTHEIFSLASTVNKWPPSPPP
jgi:hypothetical protein